MAEIFAKAKSELARHSEPGGTRDDEDDSWVVAGENESVDSFLTNCPPSYMDKSWISASHDGMAQLIEEYYVVHMGAKGVMGSSEESWGRDNMEEIKTAWEESETKTLETLTAVLKEHKYGSGKWMIFVTASEVDAVWRKILTALWDGKLGHSAKVSGNTPECNGSHVINVYVDPFWETSEVERVLSALRELCGVTDAIKYKADGVSQLGLFKGNEYGIPPSFYSAGRNAVSISKQKGSKADKERSGEAMESARSTTSTAGNNDKWGARGSSWVRREAPKPARSAPVPEKKPKEVKKMSAFATLMGAEDEDAEAILAKKAAKKEKARRKAAEAEEAAVAKAEKSIADLKAGLKTDWGDDDEEEEELEPAPATAAEDDSDSDSDSDSEEEEEEEEDDEEGSPAPVPDVSDAPVKAEPPKEKTKEELEVEALLAALDSKDPSDEPKGMSKAAAKRAKKKAAAAGGAADDGKAPADEAAPAGEVAAATEAENAGENLEGKTPADIKKLMAAKAAAAKKKKEAGGSSAAAALLAEAKAREAANGGKKKKGPKTWEAGGKQVGQKARGSDNKYQGE